MKVVVLAAGYATRLYPLTENFPKQLLEVNGKSILDYLIEDLMPSLLIFLKNGQQRAITQSPLLF